MKDQKTQEEFQKKYIEFQQLSQYSQQLEQQLTSFEQHILDLKNLFSSIEEISEIKEEKDALIPIGSGIFLDGKIKPVKETVITVGADVAVRKLVNEAKETVKKQIEDMEKLVKDTGKEIENINCRLEELRKELS